MALSAAKIAAMTDAPTTDVIVFDGFDDLDAVAPLEILTAAGFPTRLVRPAGHPATVRSAHGLVLSVEPSLGDAPALVVVPGGGYRDDDGGVRTQTAGPLPARLAELHAAGTLLASVCTGAMLLAAAGVMTDRRAVTNRIALADLAQAGADVHADARVVDDGDIVTCGGPSAGLDLSIHLVGRFLGEDAARKAADRLEYTPGGPVLTAA